VSYSIWNDISGIGQNIARGITPTASGWDTPPSDLQKATDGDITTSTGTGSTTTSGSGELGFITINPGKPTLVLTKVGFWSTGERIEVYYDASQDGSTWYRLYDLAATKSSTTEHIPPMLCVFCPFQYFRMLFYITAAGTGYVKIYEIIALEVIP